MELQTVQYLDVARQLGDIKIDKSEYDKKENYYKFITARNQYLNLTTSSTPSNKVEPAQLDETSLLLKMMFYLDKWVAINNNKGERRYNPFLAQILLARKNTIMETVPKTIHFICLCTMTDIQRDYINLWLKNNPDYLVKIWTDDDSLLVQKLVTCIQEKAAKETLMYFLPRNFNNFQETIKIFLKFKSKGNTYYTNETNQEKNEIEFFDEYFYNNPLNTEFNKTITTLIDVSIELREGHLNFDIIEMTYPEEIEVIKRTFIRQKYNSFSQRFFYWQEKFYRYFLNEKEKGDVCFDQCVIDFCIKNGLEERENLEKERTKNRAIFTKMRDYLKAANPENNIELIYKNPDGNFQSNYLNELRGNLSAASGIFALNVLISEGGIYLGTDLLPAINENLFVDLIDKTPDDPNGTLSQTIISRIILDELGNDGQMPGRTEALVKSYQLDKIDPQIESSIKNIIIEAKQRKIPLFMGLDEIKVDPYFQSSYADGNVKMLIASVKEGENNQFISKLLNNWIETYRIILQHGIHAIQLSVPNSLRNAITSTQEAFARKNLKVNAKALIHYHWDILSQYEQAIPELLGTPAYDCVYSQLLKELLNSESVETQTIDFYSFQKKVTPSFNSATFLTEEATQSHLMGAQRYLKPFINSPQYVGQCIIQLKDDVISEKTAKFLYNNNSDISEWYRYDEETKRLIPQSVGTQIDSQQEKCLIWVGNGYPIAIIDAINFLQLTQQILLKNNFHVEQMTLIACQPRRTGPIAGVGNKTLSIEGLFHACENSKPKINIKRIVAQESLFMVDMMGRQWKGSLFVNGISTGVKREIDWRIVTENDSEVIATFSGDKPQGAYTYTIPRLGTSVLTRNRVISESNKAAFGLGSVIETPLVNPGRLPPWKNNPAKLDGWIEQTMAERISQDLKNGVVVMAAESIVLVAAMCESIHELIISDPHLARIKTLMQVLERSLEVNTYVDWFASLDFACGEKQFNHLINALFTTPNELDRAFRRLQWRVCHKRFTFFNLSLSEKDNAKRIRRGMKSKTTIQAIFLGSIEEALLPGMEIDADDSTQLAQVANKVTNLNANFSDLVNDLENADNAPRSLPKLYTYSLYDPERSLIGNVETVFEKSNFNIDYIHRLLQFAWNKNKLSLSFADTAQYTKRQAWRRANLHASQGKHKKLAMNEWRLLLASIKYKTIDENYIISQLNTTRHNTIDVSAKDLSFARMMLYLNKNLQLVETNRVLKRKKRPIARSVGSMGGAGGIGGTSDSFSSLWHFFIDFTSTSDLEKKEEEIPVNKKVHSWVSLLSDFINVMSLPSTVIDGGDRLLESAINTSWLYEKCKTPINTLWNVLYQAANSEKNKWFNDIATKTGQGLGVISLLFDAYEYHEAQNHHQRSLAVTKATFDGASLAWGIAAENIMQSSAEFPPLLIVIIASYSLSKISQAIGNDIEIMFDNITRARLCGVEFNQLKNGFEKGGFTVINDTLMPCKGSVIKTINLENTRKPFVVFDDIGVQMRKKTDQGEDFIVDSNDPAAYINLRELNGVALDQSIDITGLPSFNQPALKKLVLPMSPKIKIDPVYTETDLIKWRGDTEFDAMRYFSSRESKFIFEFYKENSFIDPIKNFLGTNWMAITNLNYRYQKNNVNVYLGNDDYKLIAPGIEKNERTDDSLYRKYLHYKLYGPTKGKATIFILLNRGQSDITIARSNPSITWIIGAYHENFRDTKVEPISNGCKIFRTVPNASGETDDAIYINIDDRDNTKLTFHLSIGVGTIDFKGSTTHSVGKLIVREFNATIFKTQLTPQIIDFLDGDRRIRNMDEASRMPQMVRAYLEEMTKDSAKVLKYIPVKNLAIFGNEESNNVYYSVQSKNFVQTENKEGTLFYNTKRSHVKILFFSEIYIWFKGNLSITVDGVEQVYNDLFWVSDISNKTLKQVYLPFCHLPDSVIQGQVAYPSPSKIITFTNQKNIDRFIFFEQSYSYKQENHVLQMILQYKIDTKYPEKGLIFTEARDLPVNLATQLIQTKELVTLSDFMKNNANSNYTTVSPQIIDPWGRTGLNIIPLFNPKTETTLSIGRRLVWSSEYNPIAKGNINATLPNEIANNSEYLVSYAGTTKIVIDEEAAIAINTPVSVKHYHFWSIMDKDEKFVKLYVQQDKNSSTEINLSHFNIHNNNVLSINDTIIYTTSGFLYGLYDNQNILFVGVEENWLVKHNHWWIYFSQYIEELTRSMDGYIQFQVGQTKPIHISSHLTFSGLRQNDGLKPLAAWYDCASQQFIFCKSENSQKLSYLGMTNNSQGAWIKDVTSNNRNEIGYVDGITIDELHTLLQGIVFNDKLSSHHLIKFTGNTISDMPTSFSHINSDGEGHLKGTTVEGLLLDIERIGSEFKTILLAVTPDFTRKYPSNHALETGLTECIKNYQCYEIVKVILENNECGWYEPTSEKLFMPFGTHKLDIYLGFNRQEQCVYFMEKNENDQNLIKINKNRIRQDFQVDIVHEVGSLYERFRFNSILVLNSSKLSVLSTVEHVNIDAPALLITTPIEQTRTESFTFQIEKFRYPVIYLDHSSWGAVQCIMPGTPEAVLLSKKYRFLLLFVRKNLLVINYSFFPLRNRPDKRIKLIFKGIKVPAKGLSEYYISAPRESNLTEAKAVTLVDVILTIDKLTEYYTEQTGGATQDGHALIPCPPLEA